MMIARDGFYGRGAPLSAVGKSPSARVVEREGVKSCSALEALGQCLSNRAAPGALFTELTMPYRCAPIITQSLLQKNRRIPNPLVANSYALAVRSFSPTVLSSGTRAGRAAALGSAATRGAPKLGPRRA